MNARTNLTQLEPLVAPAARQVLGDSATIEGSHSSYVAFRHPTEPLTMTFQWGKDGRIKASAKLPENVCAVAGAYHALSDFLPHEQRTASAVSRNISAERFEKECGKVVQELRRHVLTPGIPLARKGLQSVADDHATHQDQLDAAGLIAKALRQPVRNQFGPVNTGAPQECKVHVPLDLIDGDTYGDFRFYRHGNGEINLRASTDILIKLGQYLGTLVKEARKNERDHRKRPAAG